MKQAKWKVVLLALYITAVLIARASAEQLGSVGGFFVAVVLGWCGLIVVAHLVAAVVALCDWLTRVIGREPQSEFLVDADLDVETETP